MKKRRTSPIVWLAVGVIILLLFTCLGATWPIEILAYLAVGWFRYLVRVIPEVTLVTSNVVISLLALALLTGGLHCFLGWLYQENSARLDGDDGPVEGGEVPQRTWKKAWTFSIVAGLILMFVAGIAMVGVSHQVVWLATSDEPVFKSSWGERPRISTSISIAKQITLGIKAHEEQTKQIKTTIAVDERGRLMHSWMTGLLPYMEFQHLYDQIDFDKPWDAPEHKEIFKTSIPYFVTRSPHLVHHDDDGLGLAHYAANVHIMGREDITSTADITDGAGQTILLGEVSEKLPAWGYPANWRDPAIGLGRSEAGFGGVWENGATIFAFADGSARRISSDIDPRLLQALATPDGAEEIDIDAYWEPH